MTSASSFRRPGGSHGVEPRAVWAGSALATMTSMPFRARGSLRQSAIPKAHRDRFSSNATHRDIRCQIPAASSYPRDHHRRQRRHEECSRDTETSIRPWYRFRQTRRLLTKVSSIPSSDRSKYPWPSRHFRTESCAAGRPGPSRLPQADLFQRGRPRRPLRHVGVPGAVRGGAARGVQIVAVAVVQRRSRRRA